MPVSQVYNEDCLKGLKEIPDRFFELAIIDAPYGIGLNMIYDFNLKHTIHKKKQWNAISPGSEYFEELYRVSRHQIIWGMNYFMSYIKSTGVIVHDKMRAPDQKNIRLSACDLASCSLQKRVTMFRYQWAGNLQNGRINHENTGPDARIHPTQKPIALYRWCLEKYAKKGWKILDTHMGSQSSRIAAFQLGYDYWGWEIDQDYFESGNERFKTLTKQTQLYEPGSFTTLPDSSQGQQQVLFTNSH